MKMDTKREYLNELRRQYHKARYKKKKEELIDEAVKNCGYNRKYAIVVLNKPIQLNRKQKRKRKQKYTDDLKLPLKKIWETLNRPCSKRMQPQMAEMVKVFKKWKEITVTEEQEVLLVSMGNWTIDRLLRTERIKHLKGISGTKPSKYFLNKAIPVRTNFEDVSEVGYMETDTVHHCGERLEGKYVVTLNAIDIQTLWSEQEAFEQCLKRKVIAGIENIRKRLPFKMKALDFDNGGEFKNYGLKAYCDRESIEYSRSRSYHKNDQCYVEGNNYTDVRELIGYDRFEGNEEVAMINDIYQHEHRDLNHFFYTSIKLVKKTRKGGKITKEYDKAKTPYQRVLESQDVSEERKVQLKEYYETLNPVALKASLDKKLDALTKHARVRKLQQATP